MKTFNSFPLAPMFAGDIIDRAARLYRQNFPALLRMVMAPSLTAYAGAVLYYIGARNFSLMRGDRRVVLMTALIVIGAALFVIGKAAFYAVLGGASRSLVYHFFDGTPLRARDVFRAVRERMWSLIGAMLMVGALILGFGLVIYFVTAIVLVVYVLLAGLMSSTLPSWLAAIINVVFGALVAVGVLISLLMVYSRVVYVPQVLMVEGKGVSSAVSRSFALAGGEVKRIGALLFFWFYVAWSLWLLLMIPLGWYGYWAGIDVNPFGSEQPLWYTIAQQTLTQISEMLIAPIAMLGFTLLYLDSRVRKEGFDVELLANRVLPPPSSAPPAPVIPEQQQQPDFISSSTVPSILGLSDYRPMPVQEAAPAPDLKSNTEPGLEINSPTLVGPSISQSAVGAGAEKIIVEEQSAPSPAVALQIEDVRRRCQWCGTEAGSEDRFCRVCGSVF